MIAPLSDAERLAFIAAARSLLRTPFRHTGRTTRGVDCVGLVSLSLQAVGRDVADRRDYGRNPVRDGLREVLAEHFGPPVWRMGEPMDALQPGDVLLMRWHQDGATHLFNHVGIVTAYPMGGLAMIHALQANRQVIEHRLASPWPRRIVEAFRP